MRQVLPCEQAVCGSVAPLSREKGRCDGGLHCAVRGTSPERTDHREKWSGAGKTETYHLCFLAKMMRIADSPRCCVRIFCFPVKRQIQMKKSKFAQYLTFYELFKIDSYCAVAIKWESWYNERRNAEKTSLDCSQLGRVGRE